MNVEIIYFRPCFWLRDLRLAGRGWYVTRGERDIIAGPFPTEAEAEQASRQRRAA